VVLSKRKKLKNSLLLFLLLFVGVGCMHSRMSTQMEAYDISPSAGIYPKVPVDQIILYPAKKFAPKNYVLLARLKSGGDSYCESEDVLFQEFKKKASELGADAVVVLEITRPGGGVRIETGGQPINDLGYVLHTHDTGITEVIPQLTKEHKINKDFKGYGLAIHSIP
jgi:hypothetical protein